VIARGKYSDTLLLAITNDTLVESLETGAFTFQNQDSSYYLGSTMGLQLINDDISTIKISTVQGSSRSSSYVNSVVSLDGIVTSDLQGTNEQGGFYMQDFSPDSDPLTSDGIFVSTTAFAVAKGDRVKVTGKVIENFGQTVLSTVSALTIVSNNHSVTPVNINFPLDSVSFLEHFEGMMIKVNQTLTVTENFTLGRYGELTVSANGRLLNPTNQIDPNDNPKSGTSSSGTSNLAAFSALQSLNSRSKLLICDKLSIQNPNPIPFIDPVNKTLRSGTTIDTLTGVLGYDFSVYRVYPDNGNPKFNYAARPSVPSISGANVKIAGTNVLNFFNGDGLGGGFPTARGAKNANELARQKAKIVALITAMDMDVLGLMEMENDGDSTYSAIRELVTSINSALGSNVYGYIRDSKGANGKPGSDQIKVALIYKTAVVTPVGASLSHNDASFTLLGRPPLAQTFSLNSNLEKFTVIVNHFKSKGCATSPADVLDNDQNDGQGCFNSTRKKQATALLNFISTIIQNTGDSDIVTVGDFNAYEQEDPLDLLRAGGLKSIVEDSYSYVFNGEAGSLDHGFATASMYRTLSGGAKWHVNCDEPLIIDYTTSFKTQDLYSSIPYRSSDHDPLMSGFNLLRFCGAGIPNGANVKTGNVTLKTQTEVDAFYNSTAGANYGNKWTKINGNLTLDGSNYSDPITSLCNLNYLTEITGSVIITNFNRNANPTNLDDLAGLKTVGCNLSIISNPKLIRVSLNSLNTVGCSFNIQNNAVATDIRMPQFTGMSGDKLIVKKNPKAEVISFSHQAANFSFTGKGSNIEISENGGSTSIPLRINFRKVKSLKGSLIFNNNNNTGVSNFDSIFTGLTHIYSSTYGNLVITNNTYLLKCCIAASTVVAGSRTISGNTGNCATLTAVTNDCGTLFKRSIASSSFSTGEISLDLYPNPTQGLFSLKVYGIESGLLKVQMTDLLGREILNNSYNVTDSNSVSIDMDSANAGQYILKAEINGQQIIKRFTIVK
jgi:predicted extracellular nuclease